MTAKEYAKDYSVNELIVCFLARDLEDGEDLGAGAAMSMFRAAVLLAHLTHGPNMVVKMNESRTNLVEVMTLAEYPYLTDNRWRRWAESYFTDDVQMLWNKRRLKDRFFLGALQIDKYGNSNLIGIGEDFKKLKLKGAGAAGTPEIANEAKCFYLAPGRHDTRTFVEKCDFISAVGYGDGSPDYRQRMGLRGGGPRYCVTPLCVMDFGEEIKRMRLKSVHPGVTVEQVIENTGFELIVPKDVPVTEPPTVEELEVLRSRVDPEGTLRK